MLTDRMLKFKIVWILFLSFALPANADLITKPQEPIFETGSSDLPSLYRVKVQSKTDADLLKSIGADPVLRIKGGYLILLTSAGENSISATDLEYELILSAIDRHQMALDLRRDKSNIGIYPLIYEESDLRLFRVNFDEIAGSSETLGLSPLLTENIEVVYKAPPIFRKSPDTRAVDIETLIENIKQDSLENYSDMLQAFEPRVAGTAANYASRDWCADKFTEFGFDSVVIDSFVQTIYGAPKECQNVIAYKIGSNYPEFQIIVGAHRDAVPNSPGADDNGSGTAGVLEIARVLGEIETDLTFIFILFDAEEQGLYGSWYYANRAARRNDNIVMMLNMDMIAFYQNNSSASLYTGDYLGYADIWTDLAATLPGINITGIKAGSSAYSDHHPFDQNGYDVVFVAERLFSNVYHTSHDSTTHMSFDYFTRMVKASLATAYYVSSNYVPTPELVFSYPDGIPEVQTPGLPLTFQVMVESLYNGFPIPGSGLINYSLNGGAYVSLPLTEIGGSLYEAMLPPVTCGSQIVFNFSIDEATAGTMYGLDDGSPFFIGAANGASTIFVDNFETDLGWTVTGDALDGWWERGIPAGDGNRGDPTFDYDGSGQCFLTDNVSGDSDVDEGMTSLFSPTIDASEASVLISYARWYSNDAGSAPNADEMRVFVSNDNGGSWAAVEVVGPVEQASGGWYKHSFWLEDYVTPSNQIIFRFNASDNGNPSVVEAAVDAVSVTGFTCNAGAPLIITENLPDWTAGLDYHRSLYATGGSGALTFSDKYNNLEGTGLTLSGSGLLSGVPVLSGVISFMALVTDQIFSTDEREYSINIAPAITITTDHIPNAFVNVGYSEQLSAAGGTGTLVWSDLNGDLAGTGLSLAENGLLSGIPANIGEIAFTAQVNDSPGASETRAFVMAVTSVYVCGDLDDNGNINILDIIFLINHLYKSGPAPDPVQSANVDGVGNLDILDVIYLINYKYKNGPALICQ